MPETLRLQAWSLVAGKLRTLALAAVLGAMLPGFALAAACPNGTAITSNQTCDLPASTSVKIEVWGGGGGGGGPFSGPGDYASGGGGGGGGYCAYNVTTTAGSDTLAITVGSGGAVDNNGGASQAVYSVGPITVSADGGAKGNIGVGGLGGLGGAGGAGCPGGLGGATFFNGGAGGNGVLIEGFSQGAGGGSSAGTASTGANGGNGREFSRGAGGTAPSGGGNGGDGAEDDDLGHRVTAVAGSLPGGGGGGAANVFGNTTSAAAGANGRVKVTWSLLASQTITFSNPGAQSFGTTPTLTASSSAGGGYPVSFTSATASVCTITTGGVLAFITTGSCTINANQAGDGSTQAAPQVSQTFAVNAVAPGAPTIGTATAGVASASVAFTAPVSNGGAAITGYTVTSSPGGLTGTGASSPITVSGLTNGVAYTFTVTAANSAGPGSASAASNSVTPKASQTITFSNPGAQNFGTTPTLTASSSAGGGYLISFTSDTTGVCTITTGGVLAFVRAGSCTINANQGGDGSTQAAPEVSQTFTVNAVTPGVPTSVVATAGAASASVAFSAPASTGGAAITGYTVTSSPGGFTGTGASSPITVTGLTNGVAYTFTVTAANSAGTGSASVASNSVTPRASQTITFSNPGAQSFGTTPTLTASSSAGGGYPVSFTSATTGVCTITTGGVLAFITTGNCTINANQAGDGSTLAAPQVIQSFNVNAVAPGMPTSVLATAGDSQATVSWTAPVSNGGAAITGYRVQVATSSGGVYADAAGTCAFATTGTSTAVTCTATGLTNGTQYFFKVAAVSSAGTGSYSVASSGVTPVAPVAPVTPPANPIPIVIPPPQVPGVGSNLLNPLNLSSGDGPAMTTCLLDTLRRVIGANAVFQGQTADGGARIGQTGLVVSFYALDASTSTSNGLGQGAGIYLRGTNPLNVVTSCGTFTTVPAVYSLGEWGAFLNGMGLSATFNAQGVMTVVVGGITYVARPDYAVTQGTPGAPGLVTGSDGLMRFTDSAGNTQILYPAFMDPETLVNQIAQAVSGSAVIQTDGTALVTLLNGQKFLLTPDMTLGTVPPEQFAAGWWQDGPNHYRYRNSSFSISSQGFTVRAVP